MSDNVANVLQMGIFFGFLAWLVYLKHKDSGGDE
ncbi:Uncharacterised protein [Chromobacterium violaceum]|uniref:Uncharacterized protein n=1 Tax=Chromobacterium violaceum TaxID=536 RepID=A0A3S4LKN1_CHRVL|nr:Uncharacterised protein [Chromobacterium violaceum]